MTCAGHSVLSSILGTYCLSWGFQNDITWPYWSSKPTHDLRDRKLTCAGHCVIIYAGEFWSHGDSKMVPLFHFGRQNLSMTLATRMTCAGRSVLSSILETYWGDGVSKMLSLDLIGHQNLLMTCATQSWPGRSLRNNINWWFNQVMGVSKWFHLPILSVKT
jgi:hypothetical protein